MKKTCFVIMPIGGFEYNGRFITEFELKEKYNNIIKEALLKADPELEIIRADEVGIPGGITTDILNRIMKSDFVLADITYPNLNVFYELGLRHACKTGTILLKEKQGHPTPFDVYDLRHISYDTSIAGLEELSVEIRKHLEWYYKDLDLPDNKFLDLAKQFNFSFPSFNSKKFPERLESMIEEQLYSLNFYKENVIFDITVSEVRSDRIILITEFSYDVTNRTNTKHHWNMQMNFKYGKGEIINLKFKNKKLNPKIKDFRYSRGINIPHLLNPYEKANVFFKIKETFRTTDYELYTSYHPATDLKVIVRNKFKEIQFDFEIFYFSSIIPQIRENYSEVFIKDGILPYQGVRLNWSNI